MNGLQVNVGDVLQHWKNRVLKPRLARAQRIWGRRSRSSHFA